MHAMHVAKIPSLNYIISHNFEGLCALERLDVLYV